LIDPNRGRERTDEGVEKDGSVNRRRTSRGIGKRKTLDVYGGGGKSLMNKCLKRDREKLGKGKRRKKRGSRGEGGKGGVTL